MSQNLRIYKASNSIWRPFFLFFIFLSSECFAQSSTSSILKKEKPLWELGGGFVVAKMADYPGSNRDRSLYVPFPLVIYRGKYLRADENGGVRGRFFRGKRYELGVSISGSFPASADDNPDRTGMPDLDWLGEFGPGLIIHAVKPTKEFPFLLNIHLPIRAVFSTDFKSGGEEGIKINPFMIWWYEGVFTPKTLLMGGVSPYWGSRKLHDYFYTIDPQFSLPNRATYKSDSGYMGTDVSLGLSHPLGKRGWAFMGVRQSFHQGAANTSSPLLKRKQTTAIAIGFLYYFYTSKEKVQVYK